MALIHYWPLDEASGTTAVDQIDGWESSVVNDSDGASAGAPGKFDACRDFGAASFGVSHLMLWPGAEDLAYEFTEWSFFCWFRRDETASSSFFNELLVTGIWNTGYETIWLALEKDGGGVRLDIDGSASASNYPATDPLFGTGWHLVTISCDGGSTKLMLDGGLIAEMAAAVRLQPKGQYSAIGGEGGDSYNDMRVDDAGIFDHAIGLSGHRTLWAGGDGRRASVFVDGVDPKDSSPTGAPEMVALAGAGSPIRFPVAAIFHDWTRVIDPLTTRIYYALELDDGVLAPIRLPMTSWQATLQLDRSSYVQAVVPNAGEHIAAITARDGGTIRILRGARFEDGSTQEVQIASAPLQRPRSDEGPTNHTMTLSGYAQLTPPEGASDRVLQDIRTISTDNGIRTRCGLDWWLRPGQMASARGASFEVAFINYYVTTQDEYMDVGERPL